MGCIARGPQPPTAAKSGLGSTGNLPGESLGAETAGCQHAAHSMQRAQGPSTLPQPHQPTLSPLTASLTHRRASCVPGRAWPLRAGGRLSGEDCGGWRRPLGGDLAGEGGIGRSPGGAGLSQSRVVWSAAQGAALLGSHNSKRVTTGQRNSRAESPWVSTDVSHHQTPADVPGCPPTLRDAPGHLLGLVAAEGVPGMKGHLGAAQQCGGRRHPGFPWACPIVPAPPACD